jgi:hypothetical protein
MAGEEPKLCSKRESLTSHLPLPGIQTLYHKKGDQREDALF